MSSLKGQDFKVGVCRFSEGRISPSRMALPATDDILKQLSGDEHPRPAADPASGRVQPIATDPVSGRALSDSAKVVLKQELTELIGPMAAIVCEEAWASVGSLAQALDTLSRELPDARQTARFQQNVLKRLAP